MKSALLIILLFANYSSSSENNKSENETFDAINNTVKEIFIRLKRNFNIRTYNPLTDIMDRTGTLEKGAIFSIEVPKTDIVYSKDGNVNLKKTIENWRVNSNLERKRYGPSKNKTHFYDIRIIYPDDYSKHSDKSLKIALNALTRGPQKRKPDNYSILNVKNDYEALSYLKNDAIVNYLDYPEIKKKTYLEQCLESKTHKIPEEIFPPSDRCADEKDNNRFTSMYPNKKLKSICTPKMSQRACDRKCNKYIQKISCTNSTWKFFEPEKRAHALLGYALPYANELGVNPVTLPCLAAKETTFIKPFIRTSAACKSPSKLTAAGFAQMTLGTIRDFVMRNRLSPIEENALEDMPESKAILKETLGEKLFSELETGFERERISKTPLSKDGKMKDLSFYYKKNKNGETVRVYKCSGNSRCNKVARAIYDRMASSIKFQAFLASLILKEKNYNLKNYYGSNSSKDNNRYKQKIQSCMNCMHSKLLRSDTGIGPCLTFSAKTNKRRVTEKNSEKVYKDNYLPAYERYLKYYCGGEFKCRK